MAVIDQSVFKAMQMLRSRRAPHCDKSYVHNTSLCWTQWCVEHSDVLNTVVLTRKKKGYAHFCI